MNNIEIIEQVEMLKKEYLKACNNLSDFREKVCNEIMKNHDNEFLIDNEVFEYYIYKLDLKFEYRKLIVLQKKALRKANNFHKQNEHLYYDNYLKDYYNE